MSFEETIKSGKIIKHTKSNRMMFIDDQNNSYLIVHFTMTSDVSTEVVYYRNQPQIRMPPSYEFIAELITGEKIKGCIDQAYSDNYSEQLEVHNIQWR